MEGLRLSYPFGRMATLMQDKLIGASRSLVSDMMALKMSATKMRLAARVEEGDRF